PLFCKLIEMNREILVKNPIEAEEEYLKSMHLDDSIAIRTNYLSIKIIDYINKFYEPDEASFKLACDKLLKYSSINKNNFNYVLYFLLKIFNEVGPEIIFQYLVNNYYLKENCSDEISINNKLSTHINKVIAMLPGNKIQNCILKDNKN